MDAVASLAPGARRDRRCLRRGRACRAPPSIAARRGDRPPASPAPAEARARAGCHECQDRPGPAARGEVRRSGPAEVYASLLDEGLYRCSIRTMYRILAGERRGQGAPPAAAPSRLQEARTLRRRRPTRSGPGTSPS